jgi:hypothetical protein
MWSSAEEAIFLIIDMWFATYVTCDLFSIDLPVLSGRNLICPTYPNVFDFFDFFLI